ELNDVATAGGTPSGILILKTFIFANLINNSVLTRAAIIAVAKPDEEVRLCKKTPVASAVFPSIKVTVLDKGIKIN
ncbi:hypothetical protein Q2442_25315, partial [Escherichia coli]|nr:hypothetical protein [Escherichia coli]